MFKMVHASNGAAIADGLRPTRISEGGTRFEILVNEKTERFSDAVPKLDEPREQPPILDAVQETAATFTAGFTEITQDGGTLKAEIQRKGTVEEIAKLTYGLYVKVNGSVVVEKQWPTDEEGTDASKAVTWAPGDEVELHTWMNSPAGQQKRVNIFRAPGVATA